MKNVLKRNMHRVLAFALSLVMVFTMSGVAYAAEVDNKEVANNAIEDALNKGNEFAGEVDVDATLAEIEEWVKALEDERAGEAWDAAVAEGYVAKLAEVAKELKANLAYATENYDEVVAPEVDKAVEELEAQLAALNATLMEQKEILDAKLAELEAAVEAVKEEIEEAIEVILNTIETIEAKIAEIEAQIAVIKAADAEVKANFEKAEASLEAAAKAIEEMAAIATGKDGDLVAAAEKFAAAVETLVAAAEDTAAAVVAANDAVETIIAAFEAIVDALEALDAHFGGHFADVFEFLDDAIEAAAEEAAKQALEQLKSVLAELEAAVKAQLEIANAALQAEIKAQVEAAVAELEAMAAEAKAFAEKVVADLVAYLAAGLTSDYVTDKDSYYVALGDDVAMGENAYPAKVAAELELSQRFANKAAAGLRAEDIRAMLDDSYAGDAYTAALNLDAEAVKAEIAKADLITVAFGNNTSFVKAQLLSGGAYAMDWAALVGAEGAAYVAEAFAAVEAELVAAGLDAETAALFATVLESYAYSYVGFSFNYAEAVNAIKAINADAEVVLVGMYNPVEGLAVEGIEVGEYIDYLVELTNIQLAAYAVLTPNTTFVAVPAVETNFEATAADADLTAYIAALLDDALMLPSANGQEYIKDQIINAGLKVGHICNPVKKVTPATPEADGKIEIVCEECGDVFELVDTIAKIDSVKVKYFKMKYNGKAKTPAVVSVKDANGVEISSDSYDVAYEENSAEVGTHYVTFTFKGNYAGEMKAEYTVVPAAVSSLKGYRFQYGNRVKLEWKEAEGATGYKVQYKSAKGSKYYTKYVTSLDDVKKNLSKNKKYTFKVTPYFENAAGEKLSLTSAAKSVKVTTAKSKSKFVKQVSTPSVKKSSSKKVKVTWKNIKNESGYQISRSSSENGTYIVKTVKTTSGKSTTVSGGTKGKTYYYKVRAYRTVSGKRVYGNWSKVKAYTLK